MGAPRKLKNPKANELRLAQLDATLREYRQLKSNDPPRNGWITEIRQALGMTDVQLAKRLGLARTTVSAFQRHEREGRINQKSLRKAAEGLGCELVYVLVPRTSLTAMLHHRLHQKAVQRVRSVGVTMALEEQGIGEEALDRQIRELIQEWRVSPPPDLWD